MQGLITVPSDFSVTETIDRIVAVAQSKGLTVFARIDHATNAREVGLPLRPTELIIFGNPKAGTILMQDKQTTGIDLPVKALAWEDETGKVWLTYNAADWLEDRHALSENSTAVLKAIQGGLMVVANAATHKQPS